MRNKELFIWFLYQFKVMVLMPLTFMPLKFKAVGRSKAKIRNSDKNKALYLKVAKTKRVITKKQMA
jgi:hypothetical protein